MKRWKLWTSLVLVVLMLILAFQNTEVVTFKLFFWSVAMSRVLVAALMFVAGAAAGFLLAEVLRHRRGRGAGG